MGSTITTAQAVNDINRKFRGVEVEFTQVGSTVSFVIVRIGLRNYCVEFHESYKVEEITTTITFREWSSHAKWVENVLNGLVRNESGEMVRKAEPVVSR